MRTTGNHFQSAWQILCICRLVAHTDTHTLLSLSGIHAERRAEICSHTEEKKNKKKTSKAESVYTVFSSMNNTLKKSTVSVFSTVSPFSQLTHIPRVTDLGISSRYRTGLPLQSHRRDSPLLRCPRTSWSDAANRSHMSYCRDSSGSSCPSYLHLEQEQSTTGED